MSFEKMNLFYPKKVLKNIWIQKSSKNFLIQNDCIKTIFFSCLNKIFDL